MARCRPRLDASVCPHKSMGAGGCGAPEGDSHCPTLSPPFCACKSLSLQHGACEIRVPGAGAPLSSLSLVLLTSSVMPEPTVEPQPAPAPLGPAQLQRRGVVPAPYQNTGLLIAAPRGTRLPHPSPLTRPTPAGRAIVPCNYGNCNLFY